MLIEGEQILAVAPGEWRRETNGDGQACVTVRFTVRDVGALQSQLADWVRLIGIARESDTGFAAAPTEVLEPVIVDSADATGAGLLFDAPDCIGREILPSPHSPADILAVLRRAAAALDGLHSRPIIHGALGLGSLWWMRDGSLRFPDAGLTHMLDGVASPPKVAGAYFAPEVWRRGGALPASDQYSLAVIAYELFTGRVRYSADVQNGVASLEPLTLERGERLYPGAPPNLNEVLQRALSASPGARFDSCRDFVGALEGQTANEGSLPTVHRFAGGGGGGGGVWNARIVSLASVAVLAVGASIYALRAGIIGRFAPASVSLDIPAMAATATENVGDMRPLDAISASGAAARKRSARENGSGSNSGARVPALPSLPSAPRISSRETERRAPGIPIPSAGQGTAVAVRVAVRDAADALRPDAVIASTLTSASSMQSGVRSRRTGTLSSASTGRGEVPVAGRATTRASATVTRTDPATSNSSPSPDAANVSAGGTTTSGSIGDWASNLLRGGKPASTPASAPATGTLRLSGPAGARYYVDGVLVRPTRGSVAVAAGSHDIDIVIPNGSRYRKRVRIDADKTVDVKR